MSFAIDPNSQTESFFSRRESRSRVLGLIVASASILAIRSIEIAIAAFAISLLLLLFSNVKASKITSRYAVLLISLSPFLIFIPFTSSAGDQHQLIWGLTFSLEGFLTAMTIVLKAIAIINLTWIGFCSASIHTNLAAIQRLGCPKLLTQLMLMTYRYLDVILDELQQMRIALRLRGYRNQMNLHSYQTIGRVTGTLIIRGSDRAERIAMAMQCRGFSGAMPIREKQPVKPVDLLVSVAMSAIFVMLAIWDHVR